jgi:hypothetical protein
MTSNTETILIIFVAITGVAVLLQACVLFAIYFSLRKTAQSALEATEEFKTSVLPMVHSTRALMDRISPQLVTLSADLAELAGSLKKQTHGVSFSVAEIMERVNRQSVRLDSMLTNGLNAVDRAGVLVESAVAAPVRQVNGILAAIKAVIETYRSDVPRRKPATSNGQNAPDAQNGAGI